MLRFSYLRGEKLSLSDYETFKETFPGSGVIVSGRCHLTLFPHQQVVNQFCFFNQKFFLKVVFHMFSG